MPEQPFVMLPHPSVVRDPRGSLVHVRRKDDRQCLGCIEVGLYEIVRSLILAETTKAIAECDRLEGAAGC